ncbi:MAG: Holliday junction branch migration protein RuvA [Proteobacteria bacterium]|nr:Holliday junction branch migration protein RuvA [Pseudomonadota bacterium]MCH8175612.1 Holliday junction branch migration protein RuvA [Pseudomonadota bacterium]
MIGQIRGILVAKIPPDIHLEVGGITYEIQVPLSTLYQLPEIGQKLVLHTHFVVREDAQLLYGFYDAKDKAMFRALIRVNGVGPKLGLAILSGMEVDEFVRTVRNNDVATLVNMPGIGKKTAERLIVEMRDRLAEWEVTATVGAGSEVGSGASAVTKDAETALVSLGYKPMQAAHAIAQVIKDKPGVANSEELIRLALKSMA